MTIVDYPALSLPLLGELELASLSLAPPTSPCALEGCERESCDVTPVSGFGDDVNMFDFADWIWRNTVEEEKAVMSNALTGRIETLVATQALAHEAE